MSKPDPLAHLNPLERLLYDALSDAQNHLDFCGYGDSYERECAEAQGLSKKIETALKTANGELEAERKAAEQDEYLEPFRYHGERYQTRIPKKKGKGRRGRQAAHRARILAKEEEDHDVPWYAWFGDGPW